MEWLITFGIPQRKGGWLITEQRIISAADYVTANNFANYLAMRGEQVQCVEEAVTNAF